MTIEWLAQSNRKERAAVRWAALLLTAVLLLSLAPLYAAAQYSYAGVDDYRYGATTHAVWAETGSLDKTLSEAARVARETYDSWQGSLSAVFLMALQPAVFGEGYYGWSTALLLTALTVSLLIFVWTLSRSVFFLERWESLLLASAAAVCCIQFVPTPVESYYWFNGGIYYTFYFSLSLLAAALLLRRRVRRSAGQWVWLLLLMPLIGTGNLITGLLCCVALLLYAVWTYSAEHWFDPAVLFALPLLTAAFAINVFAPGNGVRQAEHIERMQGAIPAILAAMRDGLTYSLRWFAGPTPFVLLLVAPFIWRRVKESPCRFRCPGLVSLASFLLLSAGFAPNEYAQGFAGEARVIDIQFYLFTLLLLVNIVWYTGWLCGRIQLSMRAARRIACLLVVACLLLAGAGAIVTRQVAAVSAVRLQVNGSGRAYAETWERRFIKLRDPALDTVVLEKSMRKPPLLCMVDIEADEQGTYYWYNEQIAAYYGKARVLREP